MSKRERVIAIGSAGFDRPGRRSGSPRAGLSDFFNIAPAAYGKYHCNDDKTVTGEQRPANRSYAEVFVYDTCEADCNVQNPQPNLSGGIPSPRCEHAANLIVFNKQTLIVNCSRANITKSKEIQQGKVPAAGKSFILTMNRNFGQILQRGTTLKVKQAASKAGLERGAR